MDGYSYSGIVGGRGRFVWGGGVILYLVCIVVFLCCVLVSGWVGRVRCLVLLLFSIVVF